MYGALDDYRNRDENGYREDVNNVVDYIQTTVNDCELI